MQGLLVLKGIYIKKKRSKGIFVHESQKNKQLLKM